MYMPSKRARLWLHLHPIICTLLSFDSHHGKIINTQLNTKKFSNHKLPSIFIIRPRQKSSSYKLGSGNMLSSA
uniref:Uncharacterized protein n=1 Tax=Arundo donax TaxID=35708 RepID=A0A0A9EJ28_ARUDO